MPSAVPPADLTPTFLTALFTLASAIVIHAFVAPLVQARTRRLERWEESVSELSALVQGELARGIRRFKRAATTETTIRLMAQTENLQPGVVGVLQAKVGEQYAERKTADEALEAPVARLIKLRDVIRPRLSDSDSTMLTNLVRDVRIRIRCVTEAPLRLGGGNRDMSDEDLLALGNKIDQLGGEAERSMDNLTSFVAPIALAMKPPRPIRRLLTSRISAWFRWPRRRYARVRMWAVARLERAEQHTDESARPAPETS